jgi:hypothetical protein
MAVVETSFSLSRWDYHLNRILNIWVHFIEQIEIFAFKKINFHLINAITTESSKHNHPALSSVKCPNYIGEKHMEANSIEIHVKAALSIVKSIVKASNNIIIPTIIKLTEHRRIPQDQLNNNGFRRNRTNSIQVRRENNLRVAVTTSTPTGTPTGTTSSTAGATAATAGTSAIIKSVEPMVESENIDDLFIEKAQEATNNVFQKYKKMILPLQNNIALSLNQGWLMTSTIQLAHYFLSRQSSDDYVMCNAQLSPTDVCVQVCSLFEKRKLALVRTNN